MTEVSFPSATYLPLLQLMFVFVYIRREKRCYVMEYINNRRWVTDSCENVILIVTLDVSFNLCRSYD